MQRDDALWSHGSLQDFLSVVAADRNLPGPSRELFRVIIKAVRLTTGEAHMTDAVAMNDMGRQDRKTIYRARLPLIKAEYITFTSGRFGAASIYRLARDPFWVAERIHEKRQADKERRKQASEEAAARYGALRAKKEANAKASEAPPMGQSPMWHQWGTSAPPITFTGDIVEREVMGEASSRDPFPLLPAVMKAPGEPWLTAADRVRGYRRLVALIETTANLAGMPVADLRSRLATQAVSLSIKIAEFPGDETFVALPTARAAAGCGVRLAS